MKTTRAAKFCKFYISQSGRVFLKNMPGDRNYCYHFQKKVIRDGFRERGALGHLIFCGADI